MGFAWVWLELCLGLLQEKDEEGKKMKIVQLRNEKETTSYVLK